jgi:DNA-binding NarL/FixJ family response regulator
MCPLWFASGSLFRSVDGAALGSERASIQKNTGIPGMSREEAIHRTVTSPGGRIIVLASYSGDAEVIRAMKIGASGYLLKNMRRTGLLNAIRELQ